MPLISQPNPLANGTPADGSEVYENIQTVVNLVNGGLDADNIVGPLPGTVISTSVPIPTDRIADDAVTAAKLKDDPTGAAGAVTADHIRSGVIGKVKMDTSSKLTLAQIAVTRTVYAISHGPYVAGITAVVAITATGEESGGFFRARYYAHCMNTGSGAAQFTLDQVTAASAVASASNTLIGVTVESVVYNTGTRMLTFNLVLETIANT